MKIRKLIFAAAFVVVLLIVAKPFLPHWGPQIVVDDADVMKVTDMRANQLDDYHREILRIHDIDFRIYTSPDTGDINATANKKFKELGVGSLSKSGRGILFVVDTGQNRVRMEVSASLEGIYTDAFVSYIERQNMVYYFKAGRVPEGIVSSAGLIMYRAQDAAAGHTFDAAQMPSFSTGAGAQTNAHIGEGKPMTQLQAAAQLDGTEMTPLELYKFFLSTMKDGLSVFDPRMFTKGSLRLVGNAVIPPAAVIQTYQKYSACTVDAVKIQGDYAVVRFRVTDQRCGPYFLKREDGRWKFDLVSMTAIVSNFDDIWGLDANAALPYHFAFDDWQMLRVQSQSSSRQVLIPQLPK